jgi:cytochrome b6-f complex iron-sulfur subunit
VEIHVRPLTEPTRREFCAYACQTASVVAAGSLAACSGDSPTSPSSPSAPPLNTVSGAVNGRAVSVNVDGSSALSAIGSAALVQTSLGSFLLSRTAQESFTALTAVCTHEGCTVSGFSGSQYVCPCHGSRYSTSGAVANGPAPRALQQYPTQFANNVVTFAV